jgi:hypothetical protein
MYSSAPSISLCQKQVAKVVENWGTLTQDWNPKADQEIYEHFSPPHAARGGNDLLICIEHNGEVTSQTEG